jgi:hypothetical protein
MQVPESGIEGRRGELSGASATLRLVGAPAAETVRTRR